MARTKKQKLVKLTIRISLEDQAALLSAAATLDRDPSWVLSKLAHLAVGAIELSTEVRRWLRGDTAWDAGLPNDQQALLTIGNPDPPVVRVPRRKTVAEAPPSVAEVQAYLTEKSYGFSAEEFVAHYTACGWVQGNSKKPLVDWRAACVTWQASWMLKNGVTEHTSAARWGEGRPPELDAPVDDRTATLPLEDAEPEPDGYLEDPEA